MDEQRAAATTGHFEGDSALSSAVRVYGQLSSSLNVTLYLYEWTIMTNGSIHSSASYCCLLSMLAYFAGLTATLSIPTL